MAGHYDVTQKDSIVLFSFFQDYDEKVGYIAALGKSYITLSYLSCDSSNLFVFCVIYKSTL